MKDPQAASNKSTIRIPVHPMHTTRSFHLARPLNWSFGLFASMCLIPPLLLAQFGPPPVLVQPVQPRAAMPFVQNAGARFGATDAKALLPATWLLFKRMPATAELAALKHAKMPGVLVLRPAAAPDAAECVRLLHAPKNWRIVLVLPNTVRAPQLTGLKHLGRDIEVAFPGLPQVQTAALLKPIRRASPSTISTTVCGHLLRH